jgi:hypothetical protein
MAKAVLCKYDGTNNIHYSFKTDNDHQEYEKLVVESENGLGIVTVHRMAEYEHEIKRATKWVVCKIDLTEHKARIERENKKQVLLSEMAQLHKKLEKETLYEMMAEKKPRNEGAAQLAQKP